jgi:hypothetical protein
MKFTKTHLFGANGTTFHVYLDPDGAATVRLIA